MNKILFVHHGKGLGGAALSLLYLIQGLDKTRYHPIVLFLQHSDIVQMYQDAGIDTLGPLNIMDVPHTKIWWLRWYHLHTLLRVFYDTIKTIYFVAPAILKKYQPDIIHLNTSSLIGWGLVAYYKKIPVVWHIREPLASGYIGLRKSLITACVKYFATTIVPISHNDASPWKNNAKTHIIYNAVDINKFNYDLDPTQFIAHHKLDPLVPTILFLGGLSQEKGIHIILEAFKRVHNNLPQAQLLIAGYCNLDITNQFHPKYFFPAAQFKKHVAAMINNLGTSVKILGPIYDVPHAMSASSVIVFPATVGHFARPIIEAGFMKKPVVASSLPPMNELILDGKTGFLISPYDYASWAHKLTLLLMNQHKNNQMGKDAYVFCVKKFNLKTHVNSVQYVYQSILTKEKCYQ